MQYDDLKYVNVNNKIELLTLWEFKSFFFNFQTIFLNWIISVIYGAKFTRFDTHVLEGQLEGRHMHDFFYLGPRKLRGGGVVKRFPFLAYNTNQDLNQNSETLFPPDACHLQDSQVIKLRK